MYNLINSQLSMHNYKEEKPLGFSKKYTHMKKAAMLQLRSFMKKAAMLQLRSFMKKAAMLQPRTFR